METALLALVISVSNIICVWIGAKARSGTEHTDKVKLIGPVFEPKESKMTRKEREQQQAAVQTMMHNIDVYDGTGAGQQDIRV